MTVEEVKARLKGGDYLARYLAETRGTQIGGASDRQIKCPEPSRHRHGDASPSAHYYRDGSGERVKCFGCGQSWDLFSLVMADRGLDFMGAVRWCAERWGLGLCADGAGGGGATAPRSAGEYVRDCAANYAQTDYLRKRGISDAVARRFGVGYDPVARRVVFPLGDGYAARAVDDAEPMRYKYPKGVKVSPFNMEALGNTEGRPVFIVEGQIDALSVIEAGGLAVGTGGVTHTRAIVEAAEAGRITVPVCVAFDNETNPQTRRAEAKFKAELEARGVRLFSANLYPDGCKDANEALLADREGLARRVADAVAAVANRGAVAQGAVLPDRYTLADVPEPKPEAENERVILKNGYLRKGQGMMVVSVSGAGKSVMSIQLALFWALGRPLWGMVPPRPLKVGVVQAEDDEEELAFFRRNMRGGLKAEYGWTDGELDAAIRRVVFERVVGKTGDAFIERLRDIQRDQRYDVIIVNPLFSYFGADLSNNKDDAHFFREGIDPLIKNPDYGCAIVFVHHANKPPKGADRGGWGTDAFAQYIGAGGTDVAGWTRAQLVLMPIDGHAGWFRLVAAKRGGKLGWKDADGNLTYERILAYGREYVYWRTPADGDIPEDILKEAAKMARADEVGEAEARKRILDHLRTRPPMQRTELFEWCAGVFVGFKSKVPKPCRLAYDDVVNHPEKYGLEVVRGSRGAQVLHFVSALPGMGRTVAAAGAKVGDYWEDMGGGEGEDPIDPVTGELIF